MKAKKWYIKFPLDAYAMGPIEFREPVDERRIRKYAREFSGYKRLPHGFSCWTTGETI